VGTETIDEGLVRDVDIFSDDVRQNWFDNSAEWAQSAPFYALTHGVPQLVCGRYVDARQLFLERGLFTTTVPKPELKRYDPLNGIPAITHVDGAAHDRIRRLLQPTFNAEGVERVRAGIERTVDGLLDAIETKGGEFDAVADWSARIMPEVLLGEVLGIAEERRAPYIRMIHATPLAMTVGPGEDYPDEYREAFAGARQTTEEIVAETSPGPDFVGTRTTLSTALRRLLERFPAVRLEDPGFVPTYHGQIGELTPQSVPMRTS
jgi:cytochrome P450